MSQEKYPTESNQNPEEMKMETFPGAFKAWSNAWCMDKERRSFGSNDSGPERSGEPSASDMRAEF